MTQLLKYTWLIEITYSPFNHSHGYTFSIEPYSLKLTNHHLHTEAAAFGYNLENHHHALADAEACAAIALKLL